MASYVRSLGRPAENPHSRPTKRIRSTIACQRCKQRKQRCDNDFPSCGNCKRAREDSSCSNRARRGIQPPEYVASLESKIISLEHRLNSHHANLVPNSLDEGAMHENYAFQTAKVAVAQDILETTTSTPNNDSIHSPGNLLENATGIVAISPGEYLGDSSGTPLAKIIQSTIDHSVLSNQNELNNTATLDDIRHNSLNDGLNHTKAEMPGGIVADKLVSTYLAKVHSKHPFLSRANLQRLSHRRFALRASKNMPENERMLPEQRLEYFKLHMVYAIGARYVQLTRDSVHVSPEAHYAAAIQDIEVVFDGQSIEHLHCMLLLALYQLRSPSGPGLWSMIGVVMRNCLNKGLHRKSHLPCLIDQQRKRLFWTVYMLERSVARTLGRPCCVTDREIDVELPANVSDEIEDEDELIAAIDHASRYPIQVTSLSPAIHIVRMQRIESRIHHTVYRVDKPLSFIQPRKIASLRAELEDWKSRIWDFIPPVSENEAVPYNMSEYHMIQYYKGTLLLLLPFLPTLESTDPDFLLSVHAAGQICQLYKHLHDKQQYISYSLLALHASFVAGLAMVYCFSIDNSIFDHHFSSGIRACSTVLYIIAERWPATRKVKDAFEKLVAATIESPSFGRQSRITESFSGTSQVHNSSNYHVGQLATPDNNPSLSLDGKETTSNDVLNLFGAVLDEHDHSFRWTQDGFFNAMNAFPEYGWLQ